ncbi:YbaL family putative K(+) efflux transporter [Bradyrhizobium lablabi]|uniref:YbaL family putative K(+) efflux transporter n=1 Tax=Bradyrhizobium lablabi TaxID=722472 RepID=UPI001BADE788|nr:YbaL family putative K(+) efflux transporter [Bradyrhizobium lablabi]MBR0693111.1 Kef family K(+) transporter [Bradyrhizobium lablabi]
MLHDTPLITTVIVGLGLAFVLGTLAHRFRIPPLVGYLLAGVAVGPFTPGFVADQALATQLAELGIILLMFGVGLHFSLQDLLAVRTIAVPGAVAQIVVATCMGLGLALLMGWTVAAGLVFGLALAVASTVVLLRAIQEWHLMETERGRIAVGWLIVEDLAMVLVLVLFPAVASLQAGGADKPAFEPLAAQAGLGLAGIVVLTIIKIALFIGLMLIVGRRVIPWVLHYIAHTGSRELFRLAVLSTALCIAFGSTKLFDVSLALGAFFAGMMLRESPLSQRAAQESLPLRDAFAVLFFVSVGMMFDPVSAIREPWPLIATLSIILIGKSLAAFLIVILFRRSVATALTIAASLSQIGEFSFILAELGVASRILPEEGRHLILAGAILSIMLNPLVFAAVGWLAPHLEPRQESSSTTAAAYNPIPVAKLTGHTIVIGYGRVGAIVGDTLRQQKLPFLVVEVSENALAKVKASGIEAIVGNAAHPDVLNATNPAQARHLVVAIPEAFEAGQIVQQARSANSNIRIIARAHSDAEVDHLTRLGADIVIMGEREIARGMIEELKRRCPDVAERDAERAAGCPKVRANYADRSSV